MRRGAETGVVLAIVALASVAASAMAAEEPRAPVRGVVRAVAQAAIASELAAPVARLGFKEGEAFSKGDALVVFDCRRYEAELRAAKAALKEAGVVLKASRYLESRDAGSVQDVQAAEAREEKAAAEVAAIEVRLGQCRVLAPFDGRVAELYVHEHEFPVAGKPLISILATEEQEVDLILPSQALRWLKAEEPFQFLIDETGTTHAARVVRIGAAVDTVSQTIKVIGVFSVPSSLVLPGMSGTARFERSVADSYAGGRGG